MLNTLGRFAEAHAIGPVLRERLELLHTRATTPGPYSQAITKDEVQIADTVAQLLDPKATTGPSLPPGAFATGLASWLDTLSDKQAAAWGALFEHAATSENKAKPTNKWTKQAGALIEAIGADGLAHALPGWLKQVTPDPTRIDSSLDILKGLIWAVPVAGRTDLSGAIGRFAERCFQKVRGVGARSTKLGNTSIHALSMMGDSDEARSELFRLRTVIKLPSVLKIIDDHLRVIATNAGTDVETLEDAALADYRLDRDGRLVRDFGGATGTIELAATDTALIWSNDKGVEVKAPPVSVKADHGAELSAFKQLAKNIDKARSAQARRLEAGWLEDRHWSFAEWRTHYREHALRRPIMQALIWQIGGEEDGVAVMPQGDELRALDASVRSFADDAEVRLWHPLNSAPKDVIAWRTHILDAGITQPIKQAYREIYVLTDAERNTQVYSNRFAAHILRQHQFHALCKAKDWKFDYLGGWDNWKKPHRVLAKLGMMAEFGVDPVEDDQRSDAGVPIHLATDQVRFVRRGEQVQLDQIEPIVFSEVMRDVDLFVAVTSVANDPEWRDGGPDGYNRAYWHRHAFGDLSQSAETRRDLIAQIVPRLSIADKLEVDKKALIVTGKRQQYAIHFGSTNIQILPSNRYLCIVPDRGAREAESIRLPFTGDSQLSTILAKAFMLVDEDKITDRTILTQL